MRSRWHACAARTAALAGAIGLISGCGLDATDPPPDPIGSLSPGPAKESSNFFGITYQPCSDIELEGFPKNLTRASTEYYEGPWCARVGDERQYLWTYARPLTDEQSAESVKTDVLADAEQLVLDLAAQGYHRVCGEVVPGAVADAGFERRNEPSRIRVAAVGAVSEPPQATSTQPLSLIVAVSPSERDEAIPEGAPAPPCESLVAPVSTLSP